VYGFDTLCVRYCNRGYWPVNLPGKTHLRQLKISRLKTGDKITLPALRLNAQTGLFTLHKGRALLTVAPVFAGIIFVSLTGSNS